MNRALYRLLPLLVGVALLALWEGLVRAFDVPRFVLPPPSLVVVALADNFPQLLDALWTTLKLTLLAFAASFVGGVALLCVFLLLVWRGVDLARKAKDDFGSLMAIGIVSMMLFHTFINIGMTTGIMPVVGVPLPLVSFGGSATWANLIAVGLLLGIHMRRHKILF